MPPRFLLLAALVHALLLGRGAAADGLTVRKVIGQASAKTAAALAPGTAFTTGARSKSELVGSTGVVRTGEKAEIETLARGIVLKRGLTLVAASPGALRKTVEVRAPGYRLKVRGTAQIAFEPGRSLKIAVLEGSITVSLDSLMGEFETLKPGQLLVINPSDSRLPEPVEIDLQRLLATSALVNGGLGPLETASQIGAATNVQTTLLGRGTLAATPLLLRGMENSLIVERAAGAQLQPKSAVNEERFDSNLFHGINSLTDPTAVTPSRSYVFAGTQNAADSLKDVTLTRNELNPGRTQLLRVGLQPHLTNGTPDDFPRLQGTVTAAGDIFSGANQELEFFMTEPASLVGQVKVDPGAMIFSPSGVDLTFRLGHGLSAESATLRAGSAIDERLTILALNGDIALTNSSAIKGGSISIHSFGSKASQTTVDHSSATARRDLALGKTYTLSGITIRNSSQLAAIAGSLSVLARRNNINIDSSTLKARDNLLVDAYISETDLSGATNNASGIVTVKNAQLSANAIRARAFSSGGDALIVDGGVFNATQLISLYAEGASVLRFQNNVTLETALAILAGKTVEVDLNGLVKITGKGQIYTDQANFNKPGFGNIQAGGGLIQGGFGSRPKF